MRYAVMSCCTLDAKLTFSGARVHTWRAAPSARWRGAIVPRGHFWVWATVILTAYATALRKGHDVVPVIMEVLGGFSPGAAKLLDSLSKAHGSGLKEDALSAPWCARSFKAFHSQRISVSVALHLAAADEILETARVDAELDAVHHR